MKEFCKLLFCFCALFLTPRLLAYPSVEMKIGYFFFADEKMHSVYDEGGWDIQLATSFPCWRCFQIYTSVEYLQKEGQSLGDYQKTKIWQLPVTVGLKACVKFAQTGSYYLTVGPRYFYIHVHNDSSFVDRSLHHNGIGGFLGTGITFVPFPQYSPFIIDLFGEYSYEKAHFHTSKTSVYPRDIQVGGFVFGGGLGYQF